MPLIRCDYSEIHFTEEDLRKLNKVVFDTSVELCNYNELDAQNKISIFNHPFGPVDHSTAAIEIEVRAIAREFDHPTKSRSEVRAGWLRSYEAALIPFAQSAELQAPIIFTVTFEDWEVVVITSSGSQPN